MKDHTKKERNSKEIEMKCYVLYFISLTRDTTQLETSLLNSDAVWNAVLIIQTTKRSKEKKKIIKDKKENWKKNYIRIDNNKKRIDHNREEQG